MSVFAPLSPMPAVFARAFAEPTSLNVWQWSEAHVFLDDVESRMNPGNYRIAVSPHLRWPQEQFTNPRWRQITFKKNDQSGVTRSVLNDIMYHICEDPCNILYVINSLEEGKRLARRLKKSLMASPKTRNYLSPTKEDLNEDAEMQTLTFFLRDMIIYFIGGGSIGASAGKQIARIYVDEADKIPRSTKDHGHIVEEAKSRFKTVSEAEAKIFIISKPNQEADITTVEFKRGSQHRGFMPCPHCGLMQEWVQERLKFDHCKTEAGDYDLNRVEKETFYQCAAQGSAACPDGRIYDSHRGFTTAGIEYRPTNTNPEPASLSIEMSDFLLNPAYFPDTKLGRIALDLISGYKNPAKMKAVQANRFGKEELMQEATITEDDVRWLRGNYLRGTVPRGTVFCGIYSDLQKMGPKWVKFAFRRNGEFIVIDWGTLLAIDDLMSVAAEPIEEVDEDSPPVSDGNPQPRTGKTILPTEGGIDEGDQQGQVLSFCIRSQHFFSPTKGGAKHQTRGQLVAASLRNHEGKSFYAYHFNDDQFKKELYFHRIRDHKKIIAGKSKTPRMWVPRDIDDQLLTELSNEHLTLKKSPRGYPIEEWVKKGANDLGDACKGALVMWHWIGPQVEAALAAEESKAAKSF